MVTTRSSTRAGVRAQEPLPSLPDYESSEEPIQLAPKVQSVPPQTPPPRQLLPPLDPDKPIPSIEADDPQPRPRTPSSSTSWSRLIREASTGRARRGPLLQPRQPAYDPWSTPRPPAKRRGIDAWRRDLVAAAPVRGRASPPGDKRPPPRREGTPDTRDPANWVGSASEASPRAGPKRWEADIRTYIEQGETAQDLAEARARADMAHEVAAQAQADAEARAAEAHVEATKTARLEAEARAAGRARAGARGEPRAAPRGSTWPWLGKGRRWHALYTLLVLWGIVLVAIAGLAWVNPCYLVDVGSWPCKEGDVWAVGGWKHRAAGPRARKFTPSVRQFVTTVEGTASGSVDMEWCVCTRT